MKKLILVVVALFLGGCAKPYIRPLILPDAYKEKIYQDEIHRQTEIARERLALERERLALERRRLGVEEGQR